jgi:hypothetical protein
MFLLKDEESKEGEEAVLDKEGGEELSAAQTMNDGKLGLVVSELVLLKEVSLGGVPSNPFLLLGSGPICLSPNEVFLSKRD